jgi:hypothetical protein
VVKIHGTLSNNLASAVQSAKRLRGHPVHQDTLEHWGKLVHHTRRELAGGSTEPVLPLLLDLEKELAARAT